MPVFPEWEVLGMGRKRKKKAIKFCLILRNGKNGQSGRKTPPATMKKQTAIL